MEILSKIKNLNPQKYMPSLSSIFQKEKILIIFCSIFFLIVAGMFIPQAAIAGWVGCAVGLGVAVFFGWAAGSGLIIGGVIMAASCAGFSAGEEFLATQIGKDLLAAIIFAVCTLLTSITRSFALFSAGWLQYFATSKYLSQPILTQIGFSTGWIQVRDLANMFVVLGFVVIALATILRFNDYEAKKLLPKLIGVALLINFSGLFCGLIIDGTNIFTIHFLKAGGGNVGIDMVGLFDKAASLVDWKKLGGMKDKTAYITNAIFFVIAYGMTAIAFFYLSIILVARQAIFGVLFVLSPLAFICWVFPATNKLWKMWLENFIKWGLIGAQVAFFIWIASTMLQGVITGAVTPGNSADIGGIIGILVVLYIATTVARKSSGAGAGALMGLAAGAVGLAKRTAIKGTKAAAGTALSAGKNVGGRVPVPGTGTSIAGLYTNTRNKLTKGLEGSVLPVGYTDKRKQKDVSAHDHGNATDEQLLQSYNQSQSKIASEADKDKGAAAIIEMQKRKKLTLLPQDEREKAVAHAISRGGYATEKAFSESHPNLVTGVTDKDATNKLKEEEVERLMIGADPSLTKKEVRDTVNAGYTPDALVVQYKKAEMIKEKATQKKVGYEEATESEARSSLMAIKEKEIRENNKGYTEAEVTRDLDTYEDTITDANINDKKKVMTTSKLQEKSLGYESATYDDARQELINEEIKRNPALTGSALNTHIETFSSGLNFSTVADKQKEFNQAKIAKAVDKMSPTKVAELSKEAMTEDIVRHFNENQMTSVFRNASKEVIDEFKKSAYDYIDSAITSGTAAELAKADTFDDHITEASARAKKY